ncbi:MAG: RNA polymerase sigma factor, partial [Actinobacteria bacterium]|nr:RNA polymerase sigma factor [Actinomycetota bacterium]
MPDAVLAPEKGALSDVLEQAAERGYLLVSELEPLRDPTTNREEFLEAAVTVARDRGIDVIDDLAGDEEPEGEVAMTSSRDAVRQYLDAAGRHDLLDKEQEADLSKRYDAGMIARRLLEEEADSLSPAQKAKLRRIKRDGAKAKEEMVRSNLRLVVSRAKRWLGRGVDMIELIQEGNLGLIRAVEKFDHKK